MQRTRCAFALLAGLALVAAVDAGTLDTGLLAKSVPVIKYLKRQKIQNVGVLPFRVKVGSRPASHGGAPLAANLTRRVENALIMTMDADAVNAVGVLRDAASRASQKGVGPYLAKKQSFDALFAQDYDLAWGGLTVRADAFLTGEVQNGGADRSKTKVIVELLTKDSWKDGKVVPAKTWIFDVETDAMLASDLGYNFSLSPAVLKRGVTSRQVREDISESTRRSDEDGDRTAKGNQTAAHTPDNFQGFSFELHYGGKPVELKKDSAGSEGARSPIFTAPPMKAGETITMYLTRTDKSEQKFGVVLAVNGVSTLDFQKGDPLTQRKWVYTPDMAGRRDPTKGFYESVGNGKYKVKHFRALTPEESAAKVDELGSKAGWIDIYVFGEAEEEVKDEPTMLISTRGMAGSNRQSLKDLRTRLMDANGVQVKPSPIVIREGGLLLHELEGVPAPPIGKESVKNPRLLGHLAIRYFDK